MKIRNVKKDIIWIVICVMPVYHLIAEYVLQLNVFCVKILMICSKEDVTNFQEEGD